VLPVQRAGEINLNAGDDAPLRQNARPACPNAAGFKLTRAPHARIPNNHNGTAAPAGSSPRAFRVGATHALRCADSNHHGSDRLINLRKIDANRIEHLSGVRRADERETDTSKVGSAVGSIAP
jgi:hypothetical protein